MAVSTEELPVPETGARPERRSFAKVLQHKLQSDGHSLAWLANAISVPRPTVQTWVSRGRFPAAQLEQIVSVAGLGITRQELENEYDVELTRWTRGAAPRHPALGDSHLGERHT